MKKLSKHKMSKSSFATDEITRTERLASDLQKQVTKALDDKDNLISHIEKLEETITTKNKHINLLREQIKSKDSAIDSLQEELAKICKGYRRLMFKCANMLNQ